MVKIQLAEAFWSVVKVVGLYFIFIFMLLNICSLLSKIIKRIQYFRCLLHVARMGHIVNKYKNKKGKLCFIGYFLILYQSLNRELTSTSISCEYFSIDLTPFVAKVKLFKSIQHD